MVIVDEIDNMFIDQGISPVILSELCVIINYEDIWNVIYYNREKRINILYNFIKKLFGGWVFLIKE